MNNIKVKQGVVAVDHDYHWNEDMSKCPTGCKVQLLNPDGVACYGKYNGKEAFWKAWAPLPKLRRKNNAV